MTENFDVIKKNWGNIIGQRLDAVLKHAYNTVLDVGCAKGDYVRYLNSRGYSARGCDKDRYNEWGHDKNFQLGNIERIPFKNGSFETLLVFEVIEHVSNLQSVLKELFRVCSKNIIISVPNCEDYSIIRKSGLNFNHYIDRTHVNFFTKESITELLLGNGFSIVETKMINQIYPEKIFLNSLGFSKSHIEKIASFLQKVIKKRFYMTILIVAKKNED